MSLWQFDGVARKSLGKIMTVWRFLRQDTWAPFGVSSVHCEGEAGRAGRGRRGPVHRDGQGPGEARLAPTAQDGVCPNAEWTGRSSVLQEGRVKGSVRGL